MMTFWVLPGSDGDRVLRGQGEIVALPLMPATTVVPAPVTTICWLAPEPATIESLAPPQIDATARVPPITVSLPSSALRICSVDGA